MSLKIAKPLVSVDWLFSNLENEDLIILDATIPKVIVKNQDINDEKKQIKNAVFFDIKNTFSEPNAPFPNTVLSSNKFEVNAQKIGINKDSCIVVYDDLGIYSSPRVWWLFQLMGFKNIAVLDGGFPEWKLNNYPIENPKEKYLQQGDFSVKYQPQKIKFTKDVLMSLKDNSSLIVDAR